MNKETGKNQNTVRRKEIDVTHITPEHDAAGGLLDAKMVSPAQPLNF